MAEGAQKVMALTDNDTLKDRVKTAWLEYQTQQEKYRNGCRRFRDASSQYYDDYSETQNNEENDYAEDQSVGGVNHVRTNIQTKVDTIAYANPDFHIESVIPELVDFQRKVVRAGWDKTRLTRWTKKALHNRFVGGIGILAYLYDKERGPVFEHVRKSDFAPDPAYTDIKNLRYGVRRIRIPRDEAKKLYPRYEDLLKPSSEPNNAYAPSNDSMKAYQCEFKIYWDADTEATMYGSTIIDKGKNHYGKVPLIFLQGDLSPDRDHDTGDYDNATGLQYAASLLNDAILGQGLHGGPINLFNSALFSNKSRRALETGRHQGWLDVMGGNFDSAVKRVEAEPTNPMLLQSAQMMRQAIDEATAVTSPQRGTPLEGAEFATEAAQVSNNAGSRQMTSATDYELFLDDVVNTMIDMIIQFEKPDNDEHMMILQCLSAIKTIHVIPASTLYRDPVQQQQRKLLFWNISLQASQAMPGAVNLPEAYLDVARELGEGDPHRYLAQQQGAGGVPPQAGSPGAAPGLPGPGGAPQQQGQNTLQLTHNPTGHTVNHSPTHNPSLQITDARTLHIHEAKPKEAAAKNGGGKP